MNFQMVLVIQALAELLRYDLVVRLSGLQGVRQRIARLEVSGRKLGNPQQVCSAMACAAALYWKPVQCLQRSVALTSLLRRKGWNGRLIIGFRALPFVSHAWVEIDGAVLNGSSAYQRRLRILETV